MRIDPKGTIRGYPTLLVRQTLRCLRGDFVWGEAALERAAKLPPGTGRALARALEAEGLIEASRHDGWTVTQAGDTLAVATAARPVSRPTAERALAQFLERVARVNDDPYFLAQVTRVALYGSMLKPEVKRLSDVDLAVQLVAKETDIDCRQEANAQRVEQLAIQGAGLWKFPRRAILLVFGDIPVSERAEPSDFPGRLQRREAVGVGSPASDAARGARGACTGTRTESTATRAAEATTRGVPILKP